MPRPRTTTATTSGASADSVSGEHRVCPGTGCSQVRALAARFQASLASVAVRVDGNNSVASNCFLCQGSFS